MVIVPVLSRTTEFTPAAASMNDPPFISIPERAQRLMAADIAVAVESLSPQEKSMKSMFRTREMSRVAR